MDRKSCRARKSVTTVASLVGLATALALAVPSAASAASHHDRNCGNFDHSDQAFGAPFDGHNRHRPGGFHTTAEPRDDRDGDQVGNRDDRRDGDDRMGNRDDRRDSDDGMGNRDDRRDSNDHMGNRDDRRDSNDHMGNRDDRRDSNDRMGNRDDRRDSDQRSGFASDRDRSDGDRYRAPGFRDGEISRDESGGNRNCNNFDHQGKQMYIPPGLLDDPR
jgi:transcription termination factor Rho